MSDMQDVIKAAILGHATADALGVPVEFQSRSSLDAAPVTGLREYGTHMQPKGTWSDDTSMTLAAMDSLSAGLNFEDVMERFCQWESSAKYTATDVVFDMGIATHEAIRKFQNGISPLKCGGTDEYDNGNGSLMRIIPFALYAHYAMPEASIEEKLIMIHDASALTHGHLRSQIGCGIYAFVLWELIEHPEKSSVYSGLKKAEGFYAQHSQWADELRRYERIFSEVFASLPVGEISSSGYVVLSLEAALWCLLNTESYRACVLKAVNLGSDTDTVGAIAGGLAGCLYGVDSIPKGWLSELRKYDQIITLCAKFTFSLGNMI